MSFPTTPVLDNFPYASGPLPSPWTQAFGDSEPAICDGAGHMMGWNFSGYSASYHAGVGKITDTELYCTISTPPSHFSDDGLFITYRSQNITGGGAPTGSQSGYRLEILGNGASGWNWDLGGYGGVGTMIASTPITLAAGDKIGISVIGTTHTVWYAPVATGVWGALGSAVEGTFTSGWIGMEFHNTSGTTQTKLTALGGGAPGTVTSRTRMALTGAGV